MEQLVIKAFIECFGKYSNPRVQTVSAHASQRRLFRVTNGENRAIASYNPDAKEDDAFWLLTHHFRSYGLPMPELFFRESENGIILMEDLGSTTLLDFLLQHEEEGGATPPQPVALAYEEALRYLPHVQVRAGQDIDYTQCYPRVSFDKDSMLWDVNYYLTQYLERTGVVFDKKKIIADGETLAKYVGDIEEPYFMYRDFQARNIMVNNSAKGKPGVAFIDYQQGRRGPLEYDVVSLLYQSRANLSETFRAHLKEVYLSTLSELIPIDRDSFTTRFQCFVLLRLMQVLGTYGKVGLGEQKEYFLKAIPFALKNVQQVLSTLSLPFEIPEIVRTLGVVCEGA